MKEKQEITFFSKRQKKQLSTDLDERFGITISFESDVILQTGKHKLWICTPEYEQTKELPYRVETIGLYFGQYDKRSALRLSIEGAMMFGKDATKNVIELDKKQLEYWIRGVNLDYSGTNEGYVILTHQGDIVGCGKAFHGGILNHVPKERRIKNLI